VGQKFTRDLLPIGNLEPRNRRAGVRMVRKLQKLSVQTKGAAGTENPTLVDGCR
jgi:hypothetical protein